MINVLSICCLLSLPMLFIAFRGSNYTLSALKGTSIVVFLTLGNVGESELQNQTYAISDILSGIEFESEPIHCKKYLKDESMHQFEKLRYVGLVNDSVDLSQNKSHELPRLDFNQSFTECTVLNDIFLDSFYENCYDDFECYFSFYLRDLGANCLKFLKEIEQESKHTLLLTLQCNRVYSYLGFQLPKDIVGYTWVTLDLAILTILAVYLQILHVYETNDAKRAREVIRSAGRYSVQIRNLPNMTMPELYGGLFEHFENLSPLTQVADIGIGLADEVMGLTMKAYEIKKKMAMNSKKRLVMKESKSPDQAKIDAMNQEYTKFEQELSQLITKIESKESSARQAKAAFVTFMSENGAKYAVNEYSKFTNTNFLFRKFRKNKIQKF